VKPGTLLAYHAVSGGFILGEIVQRVTGRSIRDVLASEFLDPLGFRWMNYGVAPEDVPLVGLSYPTGPRLMPPISGLMTRALGMPLDELTELSNDPRLLTGIVPAGNVVATANEMSRFMDLLRAGGTLDGVTVMKPRTIRRAIVETSYHELDRTLGFPLRYSHGFMLGAKTLSLYGPDTDEAFGHLGFTNVSMWADPRRELAVGLITSGKPAVGPHLDALWRLVRQIGREAPKVADPVLYRD
jgi:CubicO group peptidase (beta-lactamase class C family)